MSATLSPEQNDRVRAAARKLLKLHKDNISAAARALAKDQSWFNKLLKEGSGASLETASLIARELNMGVAELLGLPSARVVVWRDLPNFDNALLLARAVSAGRYPEHVWDKVAEFHTSLQPDQIDTETLLDAARLIDGLYAKKITSGSDTSPPSRRGGGHKKSSGRVRKR